MNTFWNSLYLERPPYSTWRLESNKRDVNSIIDIPTFKSILDMIISEQNSLNILYEDATILSRLIYRMKSKFRGDKGLRYMAQLNKALNNCLNMVLSKEYQDLRSTIEIGTEYCILPSKQMIQYVLVRTQGCAKLMCRIENIAKLAGHFLMERIKLGHSWENTTLAYANVSTIWGWAKRILQECCKWYNKLYSCSKKFEYIGVPWIPKHESLPSDLKSWLASDLSNVEKSICGTNNEQQVFYVQSLSEYESDMKMNVVPDNSDSSRLLLEDTLTNDKFKKESTMTSDINDIGEAIDRESFTKLVGALHHTKASSSTKRKCMDTFNKVATRKRRREK